MASVGISGSTMGRAVLDACTGDLCTAIVHRACVDYLSALRGRTHHGHNRLATKEELERFFHSAWFGILCDADGELLLSELRRMNKTGKKSIHYGVYSENREEQ